MIAPKPARTGTATMPDSVRTTVASLPIAVRVTDPPISMATMITVAQTTCGLRRFMISMLSRLGDASSVDRVRLAVTMAHYTPPASLGASGSSPLEANRVVGRIRSTAVHIHRAPGVTVGPSAIPDQEDLATVAEIAEHGLGVRAVVSDDPWLGLKRATGRQNEEAVR